MQGVSDERSDASALNWEEELKQMNITSEEFVLKIMSDPGLAEVSVSKPYLTLKPNPVTL